MKKILTLALAAVVGFGASFNSYATVVHTIKNEEIITKGANLVKEQLLTEKGWLDVYILKVNLNEENIALKPIESATLGERQSVLQMAQNSGALAAVNSDYFDMKSNTPSFGPVITQGIVKHAYNNSKVGLGPTLDMATLLIDNQNQILMENFGMKFEIHVNGHKVADASGRNNIGTNVGIPIILDSSFYKDNSVAVKKTKGVYTVVVENDTITYQSKINEVVQVPQNGYLIVMDTNNTAANYPKMPVGSTIEIKQTVTLNSQVGPSVENLKFGIGGGGLLMRNGAPYQGKAHKVSPSARNPRTIVATTNNPSEVLLVGIDGRGNSVGVTHTELLNLLKRYNIKDAMYLDGGGSTTVVARNEGKSAVTLQNTPSEGSQRRVVNGIGIFSTSTPGTLTNLYIEAPRNRTFIGEPIKFTLRGTDENSNPVNVPKENLSFNVTGLTGTWDGLNFTPDTEGDGLVIVNANGVEVATQIHVEKAPTGLRVEPSKLQLAPNSSQNVQLYGIDKDGYKIPINSQNISWTSNSQVASATGNTVASQGKGVATLTATYKNATAKLGVIVGDSVVALDSFEKTTGKWAGDTSSVKGKVEPSKDLKYHGNQAIKMTYTFEKSNNKQVAYTVLSTPIGLPVDTNSFNMWVYGKNQGDTLKAVVVDAAGKVHYLKLADNINFNGWKYVSAPLTSEIKLPAKITKLYTYANTVDKKRTSAVYFDHASITRGSRDTAGINIRDDYRFDPMYKESLQAPANGETIINAVGPTATKGIVLGNDATGKMANILKQNASMILQAASSNTKMSLIQNTYTYQNKYQEANANNTQVIFVGTDNGGIRSTSVSQWTNLKKSLEAGSQKHVIIVMSKNPLTQFGDAREGKALHDYLKTFKETTGKNVFVITTGGNEPEVKIEDGIRYLRINGLETATDNIRDGKFIKFKVAGDNIYYTFEGLQ